MSQRDGQRLSAVLLAAGESRRMGDINKLTLSIAGETLLRHTAGVLARSDLAELVVVLGHEQEVAREMLQGIPARIVYNKDFRDGQMTSVHHGLAALALPCAGIMICLSDQALLDVEDIHIIARGFATCPTSIMVPCYKGQRGNPIVLDYAHRETILADRKNLGCKRLIEKNPELVTVLDMPNDHILIDLDTPQAYTKVKQLMSENGVATDRINRTG
jgi:molybdenum cofactor cytidylyltransferase